MSVEGDAAKWQTLLQAVGSRVRSYEDMRAKWLTSEGVEFHCLDAELSRLAREVVGYLALAGVSDPADKMSDSTEGT